MFYFCFRYIYIWHIKSVWFFVDFVEQKPAVPSHGWVSLPRGFWRMGRFPECLWFPPAWLNNCSVKNKHKLLYLVPSVLPPVMQPVLLSVLELSCWSQTVKSSRPEARLTHKNSFYEQFLPHECQNCHTLKHAQTHNAVKYHKCACVCVCVCVCVCKEAQAVPKDFSS